ncbi:MAG TPA: hypothetical protein ENI11_06160 [Actinobacteria bacterium]|nr:hypothetical protein [Actinomycetota bacterium]
MNLEKTSIYGAVLALIVGLFGLIGYIPGLEVLGRFQANYYPMAPSTAIAFIIQALIILGIILQKKKRLIITVIFASLAGLTALFGLLEVPGFFSIMI